MGKAFWLNLAITEAIGIAEAYASTVKNTALKAALEKLILDGQAVLAEITNGLG